MPKSQHSRPLIVHRSASDLGAEALTRLPFGSSEEDKYPERWIQELIHGNPEVLPIDEIEPALTPLIPLCLELPTSAGPLDNLMVTPDGESFSSSASSGETRTPAER